MMPYNKINISSLIDYLKDKGAAYTYKALYGSLLLYHAYLNKHTPSWAKRVILGTIAYILNPIDAIPDLTPLLGFTDDIGILAFSLVNIACYIDDTVRMKARLRMKEIFGESQKMALLREVDNWL